MSLTVVRTSLRAVIILMILLAAAVFVVGLAVAGLFTLIKAPSETGLRGLGLVLLVVSVVLGFLMGRTNLWVEIEGETIRERRLFTGSVIERPIAGVTQIVPLVSGMVGLSDAVLDALLRTPNRGFLIRFREGRRIALIRGDLKHLDAFMAALRDRLGAGWSNRRD